VAIPMFTRKSDWVLDLESPRRYFTEDHVQTFRFWRGTSRCAGERAFVRAVAKDEARLERDLQAAEADSRCAAAASASEDYGVDLARGISPRASMRRFV